MWNTSRWLGASSHQAQGAEGREVTQTHDTQTPQTLTIPLEMFTVVLDLIYFLKAFRCVMSNIHLTSKLPECASCELNFFLNNFEQHYRLQWTKLKKVSEDSYKEVKKKGEASQLNLKDAIDDFGQQKTRGENLQREFCFGFCIRVLPSPPRHATPTHRYDNEITYETTGCTRWYVCSERNHRKFFKDNSGVTCISCQAYLYEI